MTPKTVNGSDSTIADIHRTRERISAAFGGDIHTITADARQRQEKSGRRTVSYAITPAAGKSNTALNQSGDQAAD